jgi:hypothetical protein
LEVRIYLNILFFFLDKLNIFEDGQQYTFINSYNKATEFINSAMPRNIYENNFDDYFDDVSDIENIDNFKFLDLNSTHIENDEKKSSKDEKEKYKVRKKKSNEKHTMINKPQLV